MSVRAYFNATPERRRRLLEIDFQSPLAGQKLCNFVGGSSCEQHTVIPPVDPEDIDREFLEAHGVRGRSLSSILRERTQAMPPARPLGFNCGAAKTEDYPL